MACLENMTEVRRAGRKDKSVSCYMPAAGRGQQNVREGLRVEQCRDGAVQMFAVAVPLELIVRRGDGHFF